MAQSNLGVMYEDGRGVEQSDAEAARWYREAAEQGYSPTQVYLGTQYSEGRGVAQSYSEALRWFKKAVEQGDADAQCSM